MMIFLVKGQSKWSIVKFKKKTLGCSLLINMNLQLGQDPNIVHLVRSLTSNHITFPKLIMCNDHQDL
jgi:hypothetical protein